MKSKTPIIVLAVAVIVIAAAFFGMNSGSKDVTPASAPASTPAVPAVAVAKDAYETFTLVMNKMVGEGNWSAKSHEIASTDGTLTVSGLNVKPPFAALEAAAAPAPAVTTEDDAATEGEAAAEANKAEAAAPMPVISSFDIATVTVKNSIGKAEMEAILASQDWRDKSEAKLADDITLKGLEINWNMPEAAADMGLRHSIEEFTMEKISLAAVGADNPAGGIGFLKALRLSGLSYKNANVVMTENKMKMDAKIASVQASTVAFDAPPLDGFDVIDTTGLLSAIGTISAKSVILNDLTVEATEATTTGTISFGVKKLEQKDVAGFGKIGHVALSGFSFNLPGHGEGEYPSMSASLDNVTVNGLDLTPYIQKFLPAIAAAVADPEMASMLLNEAQNLGDFFVAPFSLTDLSMVGFELKIGDAIAIKLADCQASGPYVAGEIPAIQKSSISGLEIALPNDPKYIGGHFDEVVEFTQAFGMANFIVNADVVAEYDAATGVYRQTTNKFEVKDLVEMTGSLEIGGLTVERVKVFKETPLQSIYFALMMPDQVFGDLSLNNFKLAITDKSLVDRIFNCVAKMQFGSDDGGKMIQTGAVSQIKMIMGIKGPEVLKNPDDVTSPVVAFLEKPEKIELALTADPPLSFASSKQTAPDDDLNKILDSLNIVLSANGTDYQKLRFAIPGFSSPESAE